MADLIGFSIGRVYNSKNVMPEIETVYPELFVEELVKAKQAAEERKNELSALRFRQFAESFNKKFNKEVANIE